MERGIIKWRPFNSVMDTKKVLAEEKRQMAKTTMPSLSEDQITEIEQKIITFFFSQNKAKIIYYKNGYVYSLNSLIKKIDSITKTIYLENNIILVFQQIINIQ